MEVHRLARSSGKEARISAAMLSMNEVEHQDWYSGTMLARI
jgi:hypothetical protein